MKKKNKKNHIKMRFSTILLCILAILLCAAPRGWAVIYDDGGEHNVTEDVVGCLEIGTDTTVNLYASVSQYIYAYPGSILNIHSGNVGWYIAISKDEPYTKVTVYGTNFEVDGVPLDSSATQFTVDDSSGVLTGIYGGDGGPILPSLFKPGLWFISQIPIYLGTTDAPEVEIDIKPGGNPNNINLKSKGVVPVAVLTTDGFDAGNIDPTTVEFAGVAPVRWKLEDVDDDGALDMLFHFKTQDLELDENSTEATLTGMMTMTNTITSTMTREPADGKEIRGTDKVCIVPGKK